MAIDIPGVQAVVQPSAPALRNPAEAAAPARGLQAVGDTLSKLGQEFYAANQEDQIVRGKVQTFDLLRQASEKAATNPDPNAGWAGYQDDVQKIKAQVVDLGGDQHVKDQIGLGFDHAQAITRADVFRDNLNKRVEIAHANLAALVDNYRAQALKSPGIDQTAQKQQLLEDMQRVEGVGLLHKDVSQALYMKAVQTFDNDKAEALLVTNPAKLIHDLKERDDGSVPEMIQGGDKKFQNFKDLDEFRRSQLIHEAESRGRANSLGIQDLDTNNVQKRLDSGGKDGVNLSLVDARNPTPHEKMVFLGRDYAAGVIGQALDSMYSMPPEQWGQVRDNLKSAGDREMKTRGTSFVGPMVESEFDRKEGSMIERLGRDPAGFAAIKFGEKNPNATVQDQIAALVAGQRTLNVPETSIRPMALATVNAHVSAINGMQSPDDKVAYVRKLMQDSGRYGVPVLSQLISDGKLPGAYKLLAADTEPKAWAPLIAAADASRTDLIKDIPNHKDIEKEVVAAWNDGIGQTVSNADSRALVDTVVNYALANYGRRDAGGAASATMQDLFGQHGRVGTMRVYSADLKKEGFATSLMTTATKKLNEAGTPNGFQVLGVDGTKLSRSFITQNYRWATYSGQDGKDVGSVLVDKYDMPAITVDKHGKPADVSIKFSDIKPTAMSDVTAAPAVSTARTSRQVAQEAQLQNLARLNQGLGQAPEDIQRRNAALRSRGIEVP